MLAGVRGNDLGKRKRKKMCEQKKLHLRISSFFFTKFDQISWYRIQMSALRDLDLKDAVQDSTEKNMCLDTNIPQFKIPTEEAFKSHGGQAIGPRESLRNYHFILYDLGTMVGRHLLVHLPTDHNDVNVFIIWQQQRTNRRLSGFSVLDLTYY